MAFLQELKRRNVVRVGVLYVVAAWLTLQVAELLFDAMNVPAEWLRFVIAVLILCFPLVLVFSWVFEVTPEGVKFERDVERGESITAETGRRINTTIIILLVVTVSVVAIDRLIPKQAAEPAADAMTAAVEAAAAENSIAVLPFTDLSAEGDQEYFSDGIAEEILNVLVRTEGLEVASRTTSFGFKGQEALGLSFIAERMNVRHILEGSVRKAGETVRITAQLIDAESDKHLWSETFDRELTAANLFSIQDEIAGAIVERLGALITTTAVRPEIVADTDNLAAYELYLEAHQLFTHRRELDRALQLFEAAVEVDPEFARAWAGLSAVHVIARGWGIGGWEHFEFARETANRAIELNPDLSLPYAVLGYVELVTPPFDMGAVVANYDKALERNPKDTTALLWRGSAIMDLGFFVRAERDLTRCLEIDPAYEHCRNYLAQTKLYAGDTDAALALFERNIRNGHFANPEAFEYLWLNRGDRLTALYSLFVSYDYLGAPQLVEPVADVMADRNFEFEDKRASFEALYEAALGQKLDWTEYPYMAFNFRNYAAIIHYPDSPNWWYPYPEDFRKSPHRKRLIRDFGLFAYWQKHGFPPQCRPIGADDFECD